MKTYTAQIEEVILNEFNEPTFELRVRIPVLHGSARRSLIQAQDLPIAKPRIMPGTLINKDKFLEHTETHKAVLVQSLSGSITSLYYTGFITESGATIDVGDTSEDFDILDGGTFYE